MLSADASGELLDGDPVWTVTDTAESGGFEASYVGHRGRADRAGRFLVNSTRGVVDRATVPVTVVW